MTALELLAPAKNKDIGIAAIDCGADAVYIAGPGFGARKAAGNEIADIRELCAYAHSFGARVFMTVNIVIREDELDEAHSMMLEAQEAGVDAFIIREAVIAGWKDITVPLHASTQCAIRDVEKAKFFESIGCARIVLERELPLETVREICEAVSCEVEFFVHGALCVCYSGECRLSEAIDGRSGDRGDCIQACRSLYDLEDADGRKLVRNKALLSLRDFNLRERLADLAEAGVCSFKIEGRLKNASYVRNVVRDYDLALDALVASDPERWCRASFGHVTGGFTPDTTKTFNRGYTELYLDGKRGRWSSMDAPKSMGEYLGTVISVKRSGAHGMQLSLSFDDPGTELHNGDGFAFAGREGVVGFRGDVCSGNTISCKAVDGISAGTRLWRNVDTAFEKMLETQLCRRVLAVALKLRVEMAGPSSYLIRAEASSEDGRRLAMDFDGGSETARNAARAESMLREQILKRSGNYEFSIASLEISSPGGALPFLSSSAINSMRRAIAEKLDGMPCGRRGMATGTRSFEGRLELERREMSPLMRSRYCIRYELGMCPVHQGAKPTGPLFLVNNGRRFALDFDCRACEMTVNHPQQ